MSQRRSTKQPRTTQQKSETSITQSQPNQNIDALVQRCVRFFVLNMSAGVPIQRTKIVQQVFKEKPGKMYDAVLRETTQILNDIYGLELQVFKSESTVKRYILTSALEYPELITKNQDDTFKNTLISLILTHIFMNKGSCTEKSIWDFLAELNIKPENMINEIGHIKQYVTKNLVKEQILMTDNVNDQDDVLGKIKYSWGPVADKSVSKKDILMFFSKMYEGMNIKRWSQYEEAMNQETDNAVEADKNK